MYINPFVLHIPLSEQEGGMSTVANLRWALAPFQVRILASVMSEELLGKIPWSPKEDCYSPKRNEGGGKTGYQGVQHM